MIASLVFFLDLFYQRKEKKTGSPKEKEIEKERDVLFGCLKMLFSFFFTVEKMSLFFLSFFEVQSKNRATPPLS